ncbi:ATP-binding protein [Dehalococcoides sp. THU3]|uniref:AAA family ATPase n=1 Tax=Dehalococcoides TaxID=61434 RepID=UPI0005B56C23|nr:MULTISPECIES: ATP-binding protein [Dehalococcoides]QYY57908.1 ATP-binding protein [Dehalococcoides mccartyi]BAQ34824.1 hypothetical protein UCH007_08660 [Dehalococcoides sp. UCH007]
MPFTSEDDFKLLLNSFGELPPAEKCPFLVILVGLPGTGKSTFAKCFTERIPAVILESDALRKTLIRKPVYSNTEHIRVFKAIHELMTKLLKQRVSLVLDATSMTAKDREPLYSIASSQSVKRFIVEMDLSPEIIKKRMDMRTKQGTSRSDADWEIYRMLRPMFEPVSEGCYRISTEADFQPVLEYLIKDVKTYLEQEECR